MSLDASSGDYSKIPAAALDFISGARESVGTVSNQRYLLSGMRKFDPVVAEILD